jgi:hypothetical protein
MCSRRHLAGAAMAVCGGAFLCGDAGAQGMSLNTSFRVGTFGYTVAECSRDAKVALSQAGFTLDLSELDGQKPAMAVAGSMNNSGHPSTGMIVCGPNKDIVFFVTSTESGDTADMRVMSVVQKFVAISNRK